MTASTKRRLILLSMLVTVLLLIINTLKNKNLNYNDSTDSNLTVFGQSSYEVAKLEHPIDESLCVELKSFTAGSGFEPEVSTAIKEALTVYRDSVFLDLGANIGQHSLYAAAATGSLVFAVDPLIINVVKLYHSAQLQGTLSNLTIFKNIVDWKVGSMAMQVMPANVAGSRVVENSGQADQEVVFAVLLSDIVEAILRHPRLEKKVKSSTVLIIKADLEHHECHAFLGSKDIFTNPNVYIPYVFMEWTLMDLTTQGERIYSQACPEKSLLEMTDLFVRNGYSPYRMTGVGYEKLVEAESNAWWPPMNAVLWKHRDAPPPLTGPLARF